MIHWKTRQECERFLDTLLPLAESWITLECANGHIHKLSKIIEIGDADGHASKLNNILRDNLESLVYIAERCQFFNGTSLDATLGRVMEYASYVPPMETYEWYKRNELDNTIWPTPDTPWTRFVYNKGSIEPPLTKNKCEYLVLCVREAATKAMGGGEQIMEKWGTLSDAAQDEIFPREKDGYIFDWSIDKLAGRLGLDDLEMDKALASVANAALEIKKLFIAECSNP